MEKIIMPIGYEIKAEKLSFVVRKIERNNHYKRVYHTASEFSFMPFERQNALVINCLIHSAKMLDKRTRKASKADKALGYEKSFINTAKESFLRFINGQDKDDIFNQTWENILGTENGETALLLELCKCATKAINYYYSRKAKSSKEERLYYYDGEEEEERTENFRLPHFDSPEAKAISECSKAEIFEWLPKAKRANIIMYLDLKDYGYNLSEIAEIMNVSEKTLCEYKFEYACALAIVKAQNKEFESARQILDTVKATKAEKRKAETQAIIFDMVKGIYKEKNENSKAVNAWLGLSYIERINLYTKDKKAFDKIAKLAFK